MKTNSVFLNDENKIITLIRVSDGEVVPLPTDEEVNSITVKKDAVNHCFTYGESGDASSTTSVKVNVYVSNYTINNGGSSSSLVGEKVLIDVDEVVDSTLTFTKSTDNVYKLILYPYIKYSLSGKTFYIINGQFINIYESTTSPSGPFTQITNKLTDDDLDEYQFTYSPTTSTYTSQLIAGKYYKFSFVNKPNKFLNYGTATLRKSDVYINYVEANKYSLKYTYHQANTSGDVNVYRYNRVGDEFCEFDREGAYYSKFKFNDEGGVWVNVNYADLRELDMEECEFYDGSYESNYITLRISN